MLYGDSAALKENVDREPDFQSMRAKRRRIELGKKIGWFIVILVGSLIFMIPLWWMISTALKTDIQTFADPPVWVPNPVTWEHFTFIMTSPKWQRWFLNTSYITIMSLFGGVISSSLVAFAFARLEWPGRDFWFVTMLATMMLPYQVTMVPIYLIMTRLGWVDSFRPLIMPAFLGGGPFYIFLLRQFFLTIPKELDEAAIIDGCSIFGIYWRILLPLVKPALATVAIFTFIRNWNAFLLPLIYLRSQSNWTLQLGLASLRGNYEVSGIILWNEMMAASIVVMLPSLILFFTAQKHFVQGVVMSGIKG